jgi:hypothetical protein
LPRFLWGSASGQSSDAPSHERCDLIEDLMFWHADAFIEPLENLQRDCPAISMDLAMTHVGGASSPMGLARFFPLQDAISTEAEARGDLSDVEGLAAASRSGRPVGSTFGSDPAGLGNAAGRSSLERPVNQRTKEH